MRWSERLLPVGLRRRLTLVMAVGALALTMILVGGFNVFLRAGLRRDSDSLLRARASTALASVNVVRGRLLLREAVGDQAIDRQVWVFERSRPVETPRAPAAAQSAAAQLARRPFHFIDVPAPDLRLYSLPIVKGGRSYGAVVAGESLAPYENTAGRALAASVALGALVLAAMLVALRLTIGAALRPVDRMTAEAAAWSVDDLEHRFAGAGPRDELSRLAATFNDLLARLGASFRHEQRFSSEVSHELRTPLTKLIGEAELTLRRERQPGEYRAALEAVAREAREMERVVDTLVAVARKQADPRSGTCDAAEVAAAVVGSLRGAGADGVRLELAQLDAGLRLGVDRDLAERVLAPVVANAVRYAGSVAEVELRRSDGTIEFVVSDDGPGVPPAQREDVFTPGFRGAPPAREPDGARGAGLGLALSRRLADAAGGSVRCDGDERRSWFVVSLPGA